MLEKEIEKYFVRRVEKELGGIALKFTSPGLNGVPDRIALVPQDRCYFVELKKKGEKPRKLQNYIFNKFKSLGFPVIVLDSKEQIDVFIRSVRDGRI